MKRHLVLVTLSLTCLLSAACQKPLPLANDPETRVQNLIDQGRFSEALNYSEALVEENPSNTEYRILLASVYTTRAGIRTPALAPMLQAVFQLIEQQNDYLYHPLRDQPISTTPEAMGPYLTHVFRTIEAVHGLFATIPLLPREKISDILMAIDVMNYQRNLSPDHSVYRAFLKSVYVRYVVETQIYSGSFITPQGLEFCDVNMRDFTTIFSHAANTVADMLFDLAIARPSLSETLNDVSFELQTLSFGIVDSINKAQQVDTWAKRILRQQLIQFNFLGLLVCP